MTQHFVSHVQRQRKVGVETRQENEERRDEVVDGGRPGVRRHVDGHQVDDGHDGAAQVGAQDHGASVLEGQLGGQAIDGVLVHAVHH